jgi:hypothetical protein
MLDDMTVDFVKNKSVFGVSGRGLADVDVHIWKVTARSTVAH